jgi:hypothetical protein
MATRKSKPEQPQNEQGINPGLITVQGRLAGAGDKAPIRLSGVPTADDMTLINKLSRSGSLDPESLYAFDCIPSTQNVDSYYTRMDVSSLINYANEANAGVPILNSHRSGGWRSQAELPIGRSFNGKVENDPDTANQQIFTSSAYMLRGNMANGSVNTSDIIAAIEAGTVSDISIGFTFSAGTPEKNYADRTMILCSICGNDLLDANWWDDDPDTCHHWPGEIYKSEGGKKSELCVGNVVNAHLSEYSTVYQGATPGAIILKAQRAASEGLDRAMVRRLEEAYHTRLVDYSTFPVPVIKARKEETEGQDKEPFEACGTYKVTEVTKISDLMDVKKDEERQKQDMAVDKQALDDASKEGAKLALANLAKSLMGSRSLSDDELALFPEIETRLAAGEIEEASELIGRLMLPVQGEVDENGNIRLGGFMRTDGWRVEDQDLPEGTQEDIDNPQPLKPLSSTSLVSLSLTASERQQFQGLKTENARLKAEVEQLKPYAALGEQRIAEVIDETIASYNRAGMGDGEEIREMLSRLSYDHIMNLRSQYETIAVKLFSNPDGSTGRQTQPTDPNTPAFAQGVVKGAIEANNRRDYGAYK